MPVIPLVNTVVMIVNNPVIIIHIAPKRLLFLHVLSLCILQTVRTPTTAFRFAYVIKFPNTINIIPHKIHETFAMSITACSPPAFACIQEE